MGDPIRWKAEPARLFPRLLDVAGRLRYRIPTPIAIALARVMLASTAELLPRETRENLRQLGRLSLRVLSRTATPPTRGGREYHLNTVEERRLERAYLGLSRYFESRGREPVTLGDLSEVVNRFYPSWGFPTPTLTDPLLAEVLTNRSPRRRAMAVLAAILPLGDKAIQQRCYAIDKRRRR